MTPDEFSRKVVNRIIWIVAIAFSAGYFNGSAGIVWASGGYDPEWFGPVKAVVTMAINILLMWWMMFFVVRNIGKVKSSA